MENAMKATIIEYKVTKATKNVEGAYDIDFISDCGDTITYCSVTNEEIGGKVKNLTKITQIYHFV